MGARRVGGPEGRGPDLEKVRALRVGVRRVGARRVGHRSVGVRRVGARRVGHRSVGARRVGARRRALPFSLFFSLSGVFSWKFGGV